MPESRQELRTKLQKKLRELFQFNASDLDFGIYRILNRKRDEIEAFIEEDLLNAIEKGLEEYTQDDESQLDELRQEIKNTLGEQAFKNGGLAEQYENTPLGKKYLQAKKKADKQEVGEEIEKRIYQDLYTFFSRYYDDGDFLTQRRISTRDSKYAIPYNGEEVKLHWANKDQYYIKTGEHFANYKFEANGLDVWFKVQEAEVEKDNVKESDTRYFVLRPKDPIEIDEENDTLTLWFEYRPLNDDGEEKWLEIYNEAAGKSLKTIDRERLCTAFDDWVRSEVTGRWRDALSTMPDDKEYSLLYYKLNHFTAKNTTDYFIHKNLQEFLDRELEYYLKHEVIQVDDFIKADSEQPLQTALTRAKVVRGIAEKVITFLSQIEDFQKKLFEKKKFVVDTHYCVTLDKVPEYLYETILENEQQLAYWEDCYGMDQWEQNLEWNGEWTEAALKSHPYIMVDTKFFGYDFKYELLASFDDLDEELGGLLINGENFQVLNLLNDKYQEQVKCIHIDPPYNTSSSRFLYKNNYQHSSWLSMMSQVNNTALNILSQCGSLFCHIDEYEQERLHLLFEEGPTVNSGTLVWNKGTPVTGAHGLATKHEYILCRAKDNVSIRVDKENIQKIKNKVNSLLEEYGGATDEALSEYRAWLRKSDDLAKSERTYTRFDDEGRIFRSDNMSATDKRENEKFHEALIHPNTNKPCPVPDHGWRYTPDTMEDLLEEGLILFGDDHTTTPRRKTLLEDTSSSQMPSIYFSGARGKFELDRLGIEFPFAHPTELYSYLIGAVTSTDDFVLDYFAGSGTTGHAVLNLNKEDSANRKYILVEMGQYFSTVLNPRIQKIVFSKNWKNGVPQDKDGQSHIFKYQSVESYEDALNNIDFKNQDDVQQAMEFDDYLLKYMLDFETKGVSATLLKDEAFERPFDYELKIQRGHESPAPEKVDMVETFHYLIGLWVQTLRRYEHQDRTYIISKGEIRDEDAIEDVLVVWRNTEELYLDKEAEWIAEEIIEDQTFDRIYVNGASKIKDAEPTEITFREKMFEGVT